MEVGSDDDVDQLTDNGSLVLSVCFTTVHCRLISKQNQMPLSFRRPVSSPGRISRQRRQPRILYEPRLQTSYAASVGQKDEIQSARRTSGCTSVNNLRLYGRGNGRSLAHGALVRISVCFAFFAFRVFCLSETTAGVGYLPATSEPRR